MISQQGALNTTALVVPGLYVQIVPPQNLVLNGVPSNGYGLVGTASYGPVGLATTIGSPSEYAQNFGPVLNRSFDMGTYVAIASTLGANNFTCVRATDGTDTAATASIGAQAVSGAAPATPQSGSGSYAPGDSVTLAGGTFTTAGVLAVTTTQLESAAVVAGGTGGANGTATVTGTTGTGIKFQASVTIAGGTITAVLSITVPGAYTVNPTGLAAEPVTGAGLTGATLGLKMGVLAAAVSTPGVYTAFPPNPVAQGTTSGTGTGATFNLSSGSDISLAAKYTGSAGNGISFALSPGSQPSAWNVTIGLSVTGQSELFSNIVGSGAAFWTNLANAINKGQNAFRGASAIVVATAGGGSLAPAAQTLTFAGGTDGATGITAQGLLGNDVAPRTGMYALRGQGCAIGVLCDASLSTNWSTIAAFGLSEGVLMVDAFPAASGELPSQGIAAAITTLNTSGASSYALKLLLGDWLYWYDTGNQVTRLVSPAAFWAGKRANTTVQNSTLNSQILGIIGSQQCGAPGTNQAGTYSYADFKLLDAAWIDVITNPSPGGAYWAAHNGFVSGGNTGNPQLGRETYTTMTNYLAATLNKGMGKYVGPLITQTLMAQASATLTSFLNNMLQQSQLAVEPDTGALPFAVLCDGSNNPFSRTQLGYMQADVQVQYQAVSEKFILNLQGGQGVTISLASQQAAA